MAPLVFALLTISVCATVFAAVYGLGAPWWRTWEGRAIFTLAGILAVWFDLTLIVHWHLLGLSHVEVFAVDGLITVGIDAALITLLCTVICARIMDRRRRRSTTTKKRGSP